MNKSLVKFIVFSLLGLIAFPAQALIVVELPNNDLCPSFSAIFVENIGWIYRGRVVNRMPSFDPNYQIETISRHYPNTSVGNPLTVLVPGNSCFETLTATIPTTEDYYFTIFPQPATELHSDVRVKFYGPRVIDDKTSRPIKDVNVYFTESSDVSQTDISGMLNPSLYIQTDVPHRTMYLARTGYELTKVEFDLPTELFENPNKLLAMPIDDIKMKRIPYFVREVRPIIPAQVYSDFEISTAYVEETSQPTPRYYFRLMLRHTASPALYVGYVELNDNLMNSSKPFEFQVFSADGAEKYSFKETSNLPYGLPRVELDIDKMKRQLLERPKTYTQQELNDMNPSPMNESKTSTSVQWIIGLTGIALLIIPAIGLMVMMKRKRSQEKLQNNTKRIASFNRASKSTSVHDRVLRARELTTDKRIDKTQSKIISKLCTQIELLVDEINKQMDSMNDASSQREALKIQRNVQFDEMRRFVDQGQHDLALAAETRYEQVSEAIKSFEESFVALSGMIVDKKKLLIDLSNFLKEAIDRADALIIDQQSTLNLVDIMEKSRDICQQATDRISNSKTINFDVNGLSTHISDARNTGVTADDISRLRDKLNREPSHS
ncbi:hypothetical protein A2533_05055 [Candidatus Falkowbacteria bacterium RIFOXYD2_FULL_35_9]|uniref:Uncharacterized protein n=1 Tax=Candidatus Falkowbacteria bacterium RIFOXYC2_FULL_36_12 TaxID=1798002 RepID=A0A1F5SZZ8_9BACT|nr:MAG: hypothetical protein A2300_01770 [Candidatus Falkowbacteria bacterium RIFOXYB2_FULL_35_7]OGF32242.1 MAG: hypothetical protein A2478_02865 [Candidatus Falkowbacteria bacterium RIFOXYC2_FULL_36_12]OGF34154.1 MAG: hypothetical protein A2223_01315 [Candidatus Falkowbacteria bacterium RIFOXYA2_FULL_35_8]OGF46427.1 MAG: hypothetical protein A2533_05055 [Candidatus Falkowbacteria bacterium RIFOXYD2_FULL_35_9]